MGVIVTVLVNGVAISQTILKPKDDKGEEDDTEYTLDVRTQDSEGEMRTTIDADNEDTLWIYAQVRCNKPEIDTASLTRALGFSKEGANAAWLVLGTPQMRDGFKVVSIKARPPYAEAQLVEDGRVTVPVTSLIEGQSIRGPVDLSIEGYILMIKAVG